jgi:hypothetical protein
MKNNMNADEPKVAWSDYQEITDDTDFELWHEARTSGLGAWRASLKRIIRSRNYQRAFKKFQLEKRRQLRREHYFDIGPGTYWHGQYDRLYKARASYLLTNRWMSIQFGYYTIEYSIIGNYAYSHYSHNDGIEFTLFLEMLIDVEGDDAIVEALPELFLSTEAHIFMFIKNDLPPGTPS